VGILSINYLLIEESGYKIVKRNKAIDRKTNNIERGRKV
jgi:hypothetical protein